MSRHNVWIPDDLWVRAERASHRLSLLTGWRISVSELIRRGLEGQVQSVQRRTAADKRITELQDIEARIHRLEQLQASLRKSLGDLGANQTWRSATDVRARLAEISGQIENLERSRRSLSVRIVRSRGPQGREAGEQP
jgi:hypothetical protein